MALRDQPYLPLYVQDFLTDEKLIECSAESHGVYIRLLCIMHKSSEYGTILLRQKDQQNSSTTLNFACKLSKQMPFSTDIIKNGISELLEEGVLHIEDHKLLQKRMIRDNLISQKRAKSGKKGGFATAKKTATHSAKDVAKPESENESEIKDVIKDLNEEKDLKDLKEIVENLNNVLGTNYRASSEKSKRLIRARFNEGFTKEDFFLVHQIKFSDWGQDHGMAKYLRPETLWGPKFESYLNEITPQEKSKMQTLVESAVAKYGSIS